MNATPADLAYQEWLLKNPGAPNNAQDRCPSAGAPLGLKMISDVEATCSKCGHLFWSIRPFGIVPPKPLCLCCYKVPVRCPSPPKELTPPKDPPWPDRKWIGKSNVSGFGCGFCASPVFRHQCQGCGCYFSERNFSFDPVYPRYSEAKEDAAEGDGVFDEDDGQIHEILSVEPGWFLGERFYDMLVKTSGLNLDDRGERPPAPIPMSIPEATQSDFYDARNLSGQWESLHGQFATPLSFKETVTLIKKAGLKVPSEVLREEERLSRYR